VNPTAVRTVVEPQGSGGYNVFLNTPDVDIARDAKAVRFSSGAALR